MTSKFSGKEKLWAASVFLHSPLLGLCGEQEAGQRGLWAETVGLLGLQGRSMCETLSLVLIRKAAGMDPRSTLFCFLQEIIISPSL